jgi:hypothetical protein
VQRNREHLACTVGADSNEFGVTAARADDHEAGVAKGPDNIPTAESSQPRRQS